MADYQNTTSIDVGEDALFTYLSDVSNLPEYFSRMTSASPGDGEEVHTTAKLPDGQKVEGDAWFRVDQQQKRIEWGSEGPNDYSGHLQVRAGSGGGSEVEVHVSTANVESQQVQDGVDETVANIKRLVEQQGAA